tara:strand:- start:7952 stop:8212 length:261 start_codon:yes stop_codon:yes gene_type:complete
MTIEALQSFREVVRNDAVIEAQMRETLGSGGEIDLSRAVQLGAQHGHRFSEQEVVELFASENDELSDFELELVAAGGGPSCISGEV